MKYVKMNNLLYFNL